MEPKCAVGNFDDQLNRALEAIRQQGLWRTLRRLDSPQGTRVRIEGRDLLNFSSNDYLGLASHPGLAEAAARALAQYGAGAGASRLVCGSLAPHEELERSLADFKGTPAALAFSTGFAAAMGTIPALLGRGDIVILDKLAHACLVDAAKMSGATLRVFAHNDLADLEKKLAWAAKESAKAAPTAASPRTLVVTESVFSMDGDLAPLREIVALKNQYHAWLMIDEAHATGMFGARRTGLAEAAGVAGQIEIHMGTLGKAVGAGGGYICGSQTLRDFLINRARSFVFSTAPPPAAVAAANAGLELIRSEAGERLCADLWARVDQLRARLTAAGLTVPAARSPIVPLVLGKEDVALRAAQELLAKGFLVPAIRYPTVARGKARLRVTLSAAHTAAEVDALAAALSKIL